jgi:hypothetical protein
VHVALACTGSGEGSDHFGSNVRVGSQSPKALTPNTEIGKMRRLRGARERGQARVAKVSGAPVFSNKCTFRPLG